MYRANNKDTNRAKRHCGLLDRPTDRGNRRSYRGILQLRRRNYVKHTALSGLSITSLIDGGGLL